MRYTGSDVATYEGLIFATFPLQEHRFKPSSLSASLMPRISKLKDCSCRYVLKTQDGLHLLTLDTYNNNAQHIYLVDLFVALTHARVKCTAACLRGPSEALFQLCLARMQARFWARLALETKGCCHGEVRQMRGILDRTSDVFLKVCWVQNQPMISFAHGSCKELGLQAEHALCTTWLAAVCLQLPLENEVVAAPAEHARMYIHTHKHRNLHRQYFVALQVPSLLPLVF